MRFKRINVFDTDTHHRTRERPIARPRAYQNREDSSIGPAELLRQQRGIHPTCGLPDIDDGRVVGSELERHRLNDLLVSDEEYLEATAEHLHRLNCSFNVVPECTKSECEPTRASQRLTMHHRMAGSILGELLFANGLQAVSHLAHVYQAAIAGTSAQADLDYLHGDLVVKVADAKHLSPEALVRCAPWRESHDDVVGCIGC